MAQTWLTAALWVGLALIARWLSIRNPDPPRPLQCAGGEVRC
jgi:hypothetical protein